MDDRAYKIAMMHILSQTPEPTTPRNLTRPIKKPTDPKEMIDNLSDKKILELADDAIKSYYGSLINVLIKQIIANKGIPEAFMVSDFVLKYFHSTDAPRKQLETFFANLKNKLLDEVYDIAISNKDSIKDLTLTNFKKKPTADEEVVDDYVRGILSNARKETIQYIKRLANVGR